MADIADRIKALVSKRGYLKQRLTKQRTWLNEQEINSTELPTRLEIVLTLYKQFIELNTEILELTEYDEEHENDHDNFERVFVEVKSRLQSKIKEVEKPKVSVSENTKRMQIQLPFIKLPTFTGKYDEWVAFRDTFKSIINDENNLSDIQRFHYLLGNLSGDARKLVDNIDLSEQGYKQAWSTLVNRYDNTRLIIDKHANAILNLNTMKSETSVELHKLLDNCVNHLTALKALKQPVEYWDTIIINIISSRIIGETKASWEMSIDINEIPTWEQMLRFLNNRARVLEAIESKTPEATTTSKLTPVSLNKDWKKMNIKNRLKDTSQVFATATTSNNIHCSLCDSKSHYSSQCSEFIQLSTSNRIKKVNQLNLCINCLRSGHSVGTCRARMCNVCRQRHHTLLHSHFESTSAQSTNSNMLDDKVSISLKARSNDQASVNTHLTEEVASKEVCIASTTIPPKGYTWLSTAIVNIQDSHGNQHQCRVLLDAAAQSNFLTEEMSNKLKLFHHSSETNVKGISGMTTAVQSAVCTTITSRITSYSKYLQFMVIPSITCKIPHKYNKVNNWLIPSHIKLADPQFYIPKQIDALLGADCYYECLIMEQVRLSKRLPILQNTVFGFIVGGKMEDVSNDSIVLNATINSSNTTLQQELKQLWQLEPITNQGNFTPEERECENIFCKTHSRDNSTGRYTVNLPFNEKIANLGESKQAALKRFMYLEKRLERNEDLRVQYIQFMNEYIKLGHMEPVSEDNDKQSSTFYLPHHAIIKPSSSTTKCRVVFDASAKSSSGLSLNNVLLTGPTIQNDLFSIVLRFRKHRIVFTADIEKMYRQVWVKKEHRRYQRILWRDEPKKPLQTYELRTITYGTSAAPHLAQRILQQIYISMNRATINYQPISWIISTWMMYSQELQLKKKLTE